MSYVHISGWVQLTPPSGNPVDPGFGNRPPVDPGWGHPGFAPGRPDNSLPGMGRPVDPGFGIPGFGGPIDPGFGVPGFGGPVDPGWGVGGLPHPGGGPIFPGGGHPSHQPVWPGPQPTHPIELPPGSSVPPTEIWPPQPGTVWPPQPPVPGQPLPSPQPPIVIPPNKVAVLLLVLGVGYKWAIIDKPDTQPVPPGKPQPK
jgi:hypothetical protein